VDVRIWLSPVAGVDARRWMARTLLSEATGRPAADLVLERSCDRCGRPHPANPLAGDSGEVWWSASSSGGLAAVAMAPFRVGIDLERDRESPNWERIAARFYTEAERLAVAGSPPRFLELWTLKEAYLKAIGLGLAGGLRSLDCATLSGDGEWRTTPDHPGWRFASLRPEPGFTAAVAVEGAADSIELRRWDPETEAR
jgi:4'-phosphopantetheinyl transferase